MYILKQSWVSGTNVGFDNKVDNVNPIPSDVPSSAYNEQLPMLLNL